MNDFNEANMKIVLSRVWFKLLGDLKGAYLLMQETFGMWAIT
jgi:hypothetical protein